jgi:hypothetical protein
MTTVITTFSKEGYTVYGKKWLDSFIKFWPQNSKAIVYTDFKLTIDDSRIEIKDFDKSLPHHAVYNNTVLRSNHPNTQKAIKFSYKSYVMIDQLENCKDDYLIWADGDVETLAQIPENYATDIAKNTFIVGQLEQLKKGRVHVESGLVIFNLNHPHKRIFTEEFKDYYFNYRLLGMKKPYDGHVIGSIILDSKIDHIDLNKEYNVVGAKSTPEETFLNPILKNYFIHRIWKSKFKL